MTNTSAVAAAELTARRHYELFTTAEALAAGVTKTMLNRHSRPGGRWRRVAPRVYEVRSQRRDWRRPLMAALLWGGLDAVLSYRSAAALFDLDGANRHRPPELYLPSSRQHPPWIVHRGSPPAGTVVTVLARRPTGVPPTGSELETRFIQITRATAIPAWTRQHPIRDDGVVVAYLDLCLPRLGLFTELDGRWAHSKPTAVFVDRHRQKRIVKLPGWRPLRYSWDDVVERPAATARDVEDTYRRAATGAWAAR